MKRVIIAAVAFSAATLTYARTGAQATESPVKAIPVESAAPPTEAAAPARKDERKPVKIDDLPAPVKKTFTETQYKGWTPGYAYWVSESDASWYEITMVRGSEKKVVKYNAAGSKLD